jgi:hypothetical protein
MKEFTKSLFSYSLAITFFGFKQLDNMMSSGPLDGRKPRAIEALDTLTACTLGQLGETLTDSFSAVDHLQRGVVELMFGVMFPFAAKQVKPRDKTVSIHVAEPRRWAEAMEPVHEAPFIVN